MSNIKSVIMHNRVNARVFSSGKEVYIVGGYLRDVLLREKTKDIDYIVRGDIKRFALQLVQRLFDGATIVELKKEQMVRIVLKNGMTLDFAELKGRLKDNLRERDFTMNALAWSPQTGLIDLFNGMRDIKKGIIRAISIDNLRADPLRLLRVYRFAAELGWDVDSKTRGMVKQLNRGIKKSAPERITLEFFKLLNSENYENALRTAFKDGLMESFLNIPHKRLAKNIKSLSQLESTLKKLPSRYKANLGKPFSHGLTYKGLLRLGHILTGSILSKNRLRLSRQILERLKVVHELLKTIHYSLFTASKMFDTFFKAKDALFDILILTGNIKLFNQAERFKGIWKKSFLTAKEIMYITKITEGVVLGRLIYRLKKMQFEGKLKTKKEAERWLNKKEVSDFLS